MRTEKLAVLAWVIYIHHLGRDWLSDCFTYASYMLSSSGLKCAQSLHFIHNQKALSSGRYEQMTGAERLSEHSAKVNPSYCTALVL